MFLVVLGLSLAIMFVRARLLPGLLLMMFLVQLLFRVRSGVIGDAGIIIAVAILVKEGCGVLSIGYW